MIKQLLEWLLSFFQEEKNKEQEWLENKIKEKEQELQEIEDEEMSDDDVVDHFNK